MFFSLLLSSSSMAAGSCAAAGGAAVPGKRQGMGASPALFSFMILAMALAGMVVPAAAAAVYRVGDSAGWTIIGNVNYTAWAASKTFHVGDTLVFEYNKQFHNVMEVVKADYRACNVDSPLATHTSGNDSITLKRAGHHFFLCGVPGHCVIGQKVDIRIPKRASAAAGPARVPSPSPPSSSSPTSSTGLTGGAAPGPQKNGAAPRVTAGWALVLVAAAFMHLG